MGKRVKKKCDRCGKEYNELTTYGPELLCYRCRPHGARKCKVK